MEKQGVLGDGMTLSSEDTAKSKGSAEEAVSAVYKIGNAGTLVHHAERSAIQGGVNSNIAFKQEVDQLVGQVERRCRPPS